MWRRGGRSSALDRAEALLSSSGRGEFLKSSPVKASVKAVSAGSSLNRAPFKDTQPVLSELSDLSSISVASEPKRSVDVQNVVGKKETHRGGGGSRFLKKPLTLATKDGPPSSGGIQHEPRSTQLSSQTAALQRLAQLEGRFQTKKREAVQRNPEPAPVHDLQSDLRPSPTPVPSVSRADPETKNRFLKKKPSLAANDSVRAAVRSVKSRTEGAEVGASGGDAGLNYHVSLSDEEEILKLIGDSLDSNDDSLLRRSSSGKVRQSDTSKAPSPKRSPASVPKSHNEPSQSPASPPLRNSPFRFTGPRQSHYSPSAASRTPSTPLSEEAPSVSSLSAHEKVLSLDELFPVDRSSTPSHSFNHIKVMGLDELAPASPGFIETQVLQDTPKSPVDHQHVEEGQYYSDFESETHTLASQVSEYLPEEVEEDLQKDTTQHDDTSFTYNSETYLHSSDRSPASRSSSRRTNSDSRCSPVHSSSTTSEKIFKEAAVQTHPEPLSASWSAGLAAATSAMNMVHSVPLPAHSVEALQSFNPAGNALHEVLQQQLLLMRSFIERRRHLHASLMQSLEPPNYRYTTLEDTMESIRQHRKSRVPSKGT